MGISGYIKVPAIDGVEVYKTRLFVFVINYLIFNLFLNVYLLMYI